MLSLCELRFRTFDEIEAALVATGFTVDNVYGDWDESPVTIDSPEIIFIARRD